MSGDIGILVILEIVLFTTPSSAPATTAPEPPIKDILVKLYDCHFKICTDLAAVEAPNPPNSNDSTAGPSNKAKAMFLWLPHDCIVWQLQNQNHVI